MEHDGNTIVYYEDNAEYFEIWEDGKIIGEIEKKALLLREQFYGGTIQGIQKPRYECELLVPVSVSKTFDDIFESLKWVYDSYTQHRSEK